MTQPTMGLPPPYPDFQDEEEDEEEEEEEELEYELTPFGNAA